MGKVSHGESFGGRILINAHIGVGISGFAKLSVALAPLTQLAIGSLDFHFLGSGFPVDTPKVAHFSQWGGFSNQDQVSFGSGCLMFLSEPGWVLSHFCAASPLAALLFGCVSQNRNWTPFWMGQKKLKEEPRSWFPILLEIPIWVHERCYVRASHSASPAGSFFLPLPTCLAPKLEHFQLLKNMCYYSPCWFWRESIITENVCSFFRGLEQLRTNRGICERGLSASATRFDLTAGAGSSSRCGRVPCAAWPEGSSPLRAVRRCVGIALQLLEHELLVNWPQQVA